MDTNKKTLSNIELLLSAARGIYIPRDFIEGFNINDWNIDPSDAADCIDPHGEDYWEAWENILNNARYTASDGRVYSLYQDGDLWAVCYDSMTDKEKLDFFGNE